MITLIAPLAACAIGAAVAGLFAATPLGRRLPARSMGWLLAIAPAAAFAAFVTLIPAVVAGEEITWSVDWMPAFGVRATVVLDGLSALFALLVTGIGTLVVIYSGYYFVGSHQESGGSAPSAPTPTADARFFFYILLFMTAMLGLVLAGDVITLFVFWEGTSISSFLLIAYKTGDEQARKGAFQALFVTGGGGIALLAGLLFAATLSGSAEIAAILNDGDALRSNPWYPVMLGLIAFGAFSKSAQVPLHFWLPSAMSAPTPASTYLHSATMVKAGIYLLARMQPALGGTEMWFWLLVGAGALTMITGAILGMRQVDLKAVLAYSTICQLGALVMLIGLPESEAFAALVIGILAHALYKAALFLIAGIVDHGTGTRDLRRLGSIWRAMPASLIIGGIAAMSMAGLPPMLGFLAKETLLSAVVAPGLSQALSIALPALAVAAGALMLAQAGILILDTFVTAPGAGFPQAVLELPLTGEGRDDPEDVERVDRSHLRPAHHGAPIHAHEAPAGMLLNPAILAGLSLVITLIPLPVLTGLLAQAAGAAYGGSVKVSLELWHGVNLPLLLSAVAIVAGVAVFLARSPIRAATVSEALSMDRAYEAVLRGIDRLAYVVTRTQGGRVRHYLMVMIVAIGVLLALFGGTAQVLSSPPMASTFAKQFDEAFVGANALRTFSLFLAVAAALVSVIVRRDLYAIVALGSSGLAIAVLIALEPSPDVALVQVLVDILSVVVLVLALSRLPRAQRERAEAINARQSTRATARDVSLAVLAGAVVFVICLYTFLSRPRTSVVTPYYEQNSKSLTGAADIVGAIVVDFRGFDTMIEITVFSMAGIGIFTLLRLAMKKRETEAVPVEGLTEATIASQHALPASITGIGGLRTSPFVRALAYVALPISLVVAMVQMIYGHDQPGDGFTAGVSISLGVGVWYVVFGYEQTRRRLVVLRPPLLIGAGILLVMLGSIAPVFLGGAFFSPFDLGHTLGLPLPEGFDISTSFLFEVAICLAVLGSASYIVDTLGHPEHDLE
jgi:NADH:ubiquinone oxidoreductase subunit 5 (subunit L)/multisubunit Na+/H+ antiporter MnhA subunit/multisubunit Na+/H+ antiporter MnhB subunit